MAGVMSTTANDKTEELKFGGNFDAVKRVGEGRAAEVFLCRRGRQQVAISVPKSANRNPNEAKLFEALNSADQGSSKHLIRLLETVEVTVGGERRIGLVLEYGGESLRLLIKREGKLSCSSALAIHDQVCNAILSLEQMGWLHTDIGPSNILVDDCGRVKVCDYGNAMPVAEFSMASYRNNRRYGAPPIYKKNPDLFSAALTLYEMAAGEHLIVPFREDSDFESLKVETVTRKLAFYEDGAVGVPYRRKIEALDSDVASRVCKLLNH